MRKNSETRQKITREQRRTKSNESPKQEHEQIHPKATKHRETTQHIHRNNTITIESNTIINRRRNYERNATIKSYAVHTL